MYKLSFLVQCSDIDIIIWLACLALFQVLVRLQNDAIKIEKKCDVVRLLSRSCHSLVQPDFGMTRAEVVRLSSAEPNTFFCLVLVQLMFGSESGIPVRVRLDSVSGWFKNFVRDCRSSRMQPCKLMNKPNYFQINKKKLGTMVLKIIRKASECGSSLMKTCDDGHKHQACCNNKTWHSIHHRAY